jgi:hypothetical protein
VIALTAYLILTNNIAQKVPFLFGRRKRHCETTQVNSNRKAIFETKMAEEATIQKTTEEETGGLGSKAPKKRFEVKEVFFFSSFLLAYCLPFFFLFFFLLFLFFFLLFF